MRDLLLNHGYSFDEDEKNRFVKFLDEAFDADTFRHRARCVIESYKIFNQSDMPRHVPINDR